MIVMGERVKELRNKSRYTQTDLAKLLGVTKSTVAAYENDSRLPSYDVLVRMSRVFKVTTDYLILGNEGVPTINVSGLSREQMYYVTKMIEGFQIENLVREIVNDDSTYSELKEKNKKIFGKDNQKAGVVVDKLIDMAKSGK